MKLVKFANNFTKFLEFANNSMKFVEFANNFTKFVGLAKAANNLQSSWDVLITHGKSLSPAKLYEVCRLKCRI